MFKKIAITTLFASSLLLAESGVAININEDDLELEATLDSRNLLLMQGTQTILEGEVNFLNINEDEKSIGVGLGATNKLEGLEGVELTLGAKVVWAEVGRDNFAAMPLMGKVKYTLPPLMYNIPPVSLQGKILYAPKVLAFGDSKKYTEFRLESDMEIINNVNIYAGYRNIHRDYDNSVSDLFDSGFYTGLKFVY